MIAAIVISEHSEECMSELSPSSVLKLQQIQSQIFFVYKRFIGKCTSHLRTLNAYNIDQTVQPNESITNIIKTNYTR